MAAEQNGVTEEEMKQYRREWKRTNDGLADRYEKLKKKVVALEKMLDEFASKQSKVNQEFEKQINALKK